MKGEIVSQKESVWQSYTIKIFINSESVLQSAVHHKADADVLCFSANDSTDDVTR